MIAFYNRHVGDVLMLIVANDEGAATSYEKKGQIARVFRTDTMETVAWNLFEATHLLPRLAQVENGQVALSEDEVGQLNHLLSKAGFADFLTCDKQPKFVVAQILEMSEHPDSDHLHICKVNVGFADPVQIVCGAPNAAVGLKTVAALPGAMMPNGSLIFPGSLRGVASYGMLCSARELALPNAPQVRGIIELAENVTAGSAFDVASMWTA